MKHILEYNIDPFGEEDWDEKESDDDIIQYIKNTVYRNGGHISMMELDAGASPVYDSGHDYIDLIEYLYGDTIGVTPYYGYKYQTVGDIYEVPYEDVDAELLYEIKELIDDSDLN